MPNLASSSVARTSIFLLVSLTSAMGCVSGNPLPDGSNGGTGGSGGASGASGTSTGGSSTGGAGASAGTSGTSGTSAGTTGSAGSSGTGGMSGTAGDGGSAGTNGADGTAGVSGEAGTSGAGGSGETGGSNGTAGGGGVGGTAGIAGTSGSTSGSNGTAGAGNTSGSSGTAGISGASGTAGISGNSGTAGTGSTALCSGAGSSVFFGEYLLGAGNEKGITLYNSGTSSTALSSCSVKIYANGGTSATNTVSLAGVPSLAASGTKSICNNSASFASSCDVSSGSLTFTGNDAVTFECNGSIQDVIGQIGDDPGTEWTANGVSTKGQAIRRHCSVTTGDSNGCDAFDPSVQWDKLASATSSALTGHVCSGGTGGSSGTGGSAGAGGTAGTAGTGGTAGVAGTAGTGGVPSGWTCDPDIYGVGDECDCDCGVYDPDCTNSALALYCGGVPDTLGRTCNAASATCMSVACTPHLVINEVSTDGATASDEFVEIYYPPTCSQTVSLSGWMLKYSSASGSVPAMYWTGGATDSIAPGGYFVLGGSGFNGAHQGSFTSGMSKTGGGVGLYNGTTRVDSVAWSTATASNPLAEGTPTANIPSGSSAQRKPNGTDNNNNVNDFLIVTARTPGGPTL